MTKEIKPIKSILFAIFLAVSLVYIAQSQNQVDVVYAQSTDPPDIACIGPAVANYIDSVMAGAQGCSIGSSNFEGLGIFTNGGGSATEFVTEQTPRTVLLLDNFGFASQIPSSTIVVGRSSGINNLSDLNRDMPTLMNGNSAIDVWQGANEMLSHGASFQDLTNHDLALINHGQAHGKGVCIGNFKEGWPTNLSSAEFTNYASQIMTAANNASIPVYLCVHEHENTQWTFGQRYNGRFTQIRNAGLNLPVIVTVAGYDSQAGPNVDAGSGWHGVFSEEEYLDMLLEYQSAALANGAVGVAVFQMGLGGQWNSFDITPLMTSISTTNCTGSNQLEYIKFLSPAFNMTSPYLQEMVNTIASNSTAWNQLDGIAGNAYNFQGGPYIRDWVTQARANPNIGTRPMMLTEIGWYEVLQGTPTSEAAANLANEISWLRSQPDTGNNSILGAQLFNAFNTNAGWSDYDVSGQLGTICPGGCGKVGANSATYYSSSYDSFYNPAQSAGMTTTIEIANNDNNPTLPSIMPGVNGAHERGITPIIRIGVMDNSGGFSDPADYVTFLQNLNTQIGLNYQEDVYVIVGPNEPITECWAAPQCYATCDATVNGQFSCVQSDWPITGPDVNEPEPSCACPSCSQNIVDPQAPNRPSRSSYGQTDGTGAGQYTFYDNDIRDFVEVLPIMEYASVATGIGIPPGGGGTTGPGIGCGGSGDSIFDDLFNAAYPFPAPIDPYNTAPGIIAGMRSRTTTDGTNMTLEQVYQAIEDATDVPCEYMMGLHYVEGANGPDASFQNGYDFRALGFNTLLESGISAANEIKDRSDDRYDGNGGAGITITEIQQLIIGDSFYGGGGNAQCQWANYENPEYDPEDVLTEYTVCPPPVKGDDDPHTTNFIDANHFDMAIIYPAAFYINGVLTGIKADEFCGAGDYVELANGDTVWQSTYCPNNSSAHVLCTQCPPPIVTQRHSSLSMAVWYYLSNQGQT